MATNAFVTVVRDKGSGSRTAMQRFFDEHDISISSNIEMNENEAIKQSVQAFRQFVLSKASEFVKVDYMYYI